MLKTGGKNSRGYFREEFEVEKRAEIPLVERYMVEIPLNKLRFYTKWPIRNIAVE